MTTDRDLIRAAVLHSFVEDERPITVREIAAMADLTEYKVRKLIDTDTELQWDLRPVQVERAQESKDYPGFVLRYRKVWAYEPSTQFIRSELARLASAPAIKE